MGGTNNDVPRPPRSPGDPRPTCPERLLAILSDPGGLTRGEPLEIVVEGAERPGVALLTRAGLRLGTIAGIPYLQDLIRCLRDGVEYRAEVDRVDSGAVHCVLVRVAG